MKKSDVMSLGKKINPSHVMFIKFCVQNFGQSIYNKYSI